MFNFLRNLFKSQFDEWNQRRAMFEDAGRIDRGGKSKAEHWITPFNLLIFFNSVLVIFLLELSKHTLSTLNVTEYGYVFFTVMFVVLYSFVNFFVYAFLCETVIFPKIKSFALKENDEKFHILALKVSFSTVLTFLILAIWSFFS